MLLATYCYRKRTKPPFQKVPKSRAVHRTRSAYRTPASTQDKESFHKDFTQKRFYSTSLPPDCTLVGYVTSVGKSVFGLRSFQINSIETTDAKTNRLGRKEQKRLPDPI